MFYTTNFSPLLVTKQGFMLIPILSVSTAFKLKILKILWRCTLIPYHRIVCYLLRPTSSVLALCSDFNEPSIWCVGIDSTPQTINPQFHTESNYCAKCWSEKPTIGGLICSQPFISRCRKVRFGRGFDKAWLEMINLFLDKIHMDNCEECLKLWMVGA